MHSKRCFPVIGPFRRILPRTTGYAPSGRSSASPTSGLAPPVPDNTHNGCCSQRQLTGYCAGQWPPVSQPRPPQRPWARGCRGGWGRRDARRQLYATMCCLEQLTALVGTSPSCPRRLQTPRKREAGGAPPRASWAPVRATHPPATDRQQRLVGGVGRAAAAVLPQSSWR